MDYDSLLDYCLGKPGAWKDTPWDHEIVAKVDKKIFAFTGEDSVTVKCGVDREEADEWLLMYPDDAAVSPYIGKSGWNTLRIDGAIPGREIREAIDDSYAMVVSNLPKSRRPEGWDG